MLYFYASEFGISNGDIQVKDGNVTWHFNDSAITAISLSSANCGATANVVRYLLNGDYDEVGYICHTYKNGEGGGHVYNYIQSNGTYYVFDMTAYSSNSYNPGMHAIVRLSSLDEYAEKYSEMPGYGNYIPVIYAYKAPKEIPMAWNNNNCNTTWYPTGTELTVIYEDIANGYSIDYRDLSETISIQIEAKRKDRTLTTGDMTNFPGLTAFALPNKFGGATLSNEQIEALVGAPLEDVAKSVKTVEDALMFLYAAGYEFGGSDITCDGDGYQLWHFNHFAETVINKRIIGCGQTAALVRYLLDGDYDEVGYMCHTYEDGLGGGHVYNYLKTEDEFFIIDMTQLTSTGYSPKSKAAMAIGNDLSNYGSTWPKLFTKGVKVIYAYNSLRELPLSWDYINGVYVTNLPESAKDSVKIILETPNEGYTVGFYSLSDELWEYINTLR